MNNKSKLILKIILGFFVILVLLSLLNKEIKGDLYRCSDNLNELNNSFENLSKEIVLKDEKISLLQNERNELKKLPLFNFNPSLDEVKRILKEDKTNENPYIENEYDCLDYSSDLVSTFLENKIHSCVVWIYFDDLMGHFLVTINTKDNGIIYIEPQEDKIIYELNIGDDYCDKSLWDCNWEIAKIKSCYEK